MAALKGSHLGIPLAVAIAVHNIPEGMAVAAPLYSATKCKWTALKWCIVSGMFEPLAAIIVGIFFTRFLTTYIVQCSLASVSGIMVYMCLKELTPYALKSLEPGHALTSFSLGMFVIFLSIHFLHTILGTHTQNYRY